MTVARTQEEVLTKMRDAYVETYGGPPETFEITTKIFKDLKADYPDSAYVLDWIHSTARRLGINENELPRPIYGREYTIGELRGMLMIA